MMEKKESIPCLLTYLNLHRYFPLVNLTVLYLICMSISSCTFFAESFEPDGQFQLAVAAGLKIIRFLRDL